MQGIARMDRELLDAAEIVGDLVAPGSVFAFLAEHRRELFDDDFIADLFSSKTGRPSLPADLVGSVLILKELYDLSDPQTADALTEFVEVGQSGVVTAWAWVGEPRSNNPVQKPFAWALIKLDGADTAMLHVVDAGAEANDEVGVSVVLDVSPSLDGRLDQVSHAPLHGERAR